MCEVEKESTCCPKRRAVNKRVAAVILIIFIVFKQELWRCKISVKDLFLSRNFVFDVSADDGDPRGNGEKEKNIRPSCVFPVST